MREVMMVGEEGRGRGKEVFKLVMRGIYSIVKAIESRKQQRKERAG
jgi:hypothetical protein